MKSQYPHFVKSLNKTHRKRSFPREELQWLKGTRDLKDSCRWNTAYRKYSSISLLSVDVCVLLCRNEMILQNIILTLVLSGCMIKDNLHLLLCLKKKKQPVSPPLFCCPSPFSLCAPKVYIWDIVPLSTGKTKALWDWLHSAYLPSPFPPNPMSNSSAPTYNGLFQFCIQPALLGSFLAMKTSLAPPCQCHPRGSCRAPSACCYSGPSHCPILHALPVHELC